MDSSLRYQFFTYLYYFGQVTKSLRTIFHPLIYVIMPMLLSFANYCALRSVPYPDWALQMCFPPVLFFITEGPGLPFLVI